jgi:hypothetical protein
MTLLEFEHGVFAAALSSPICDIPAVRRVTPTSISMRIYVAGGGFIDAFYNEQTGTTAFASIRQGRHPLPRGKGKAPSTTGCTCSARRR